jgi:hypothetical protein
MGVQLPPWVQKEFESCRGRSMMVRLIFRPNLISCSLQYSSGCHIVPLDENSTYMNDVYVILEARQRMRFRNRLAYSSMELEKFDRIEWTWKSYRSWEVPGY